MPETSHGYENFKIRPMPFPVPDRVGSWWRHRWLFELPQEGRGFRLPPPVGEIEELQMVAGAYWESEKRLVLELHTRSGTLSGDELTYVSIVAAWLRVCFPDGEILVNGVRDHALLKMSRLSPEIVRQLREHGYGIAEI